MSLIEEAYALLLPLSRGIDPRTGEILAEDHLCRDPQMMRALVTALTLLERAPMPPTSRQNVTEGEQQYQPWTSEEDAELRAEFAAQMKVGEMARRHARTSGAIRSRLQKLDLI